MHEPWLNLIWTIVIYGMVFGILWWALGYFRGQIPQPFAMIATVVIVAAICIVAIGILLGGVSLIPFGAFGGVRI